MWYSSKITNTPVKSVRYTIYKVIIKTLVTAVYSVYSEQTKHSYNMTV